jgi:hypothetical protein
MSMFDRSNVGEQEKRVVVRHNGGTRWTLRPNEMPPPELRALLREHRATLVDKLKGRPAAAVVEWSEGDIDARVTIVASVPHGMERVEGDPAFYELLAKMHEAFTLPFPLRVIPFPGGRVQ